MQVWRSLPSLCAAFVGAALLLFTTPLIAADARVLNALLDGVLEQHVVNGEVDYPAIARNTRFYKYIEALAEFPIDSLSDDKQRMAFWINAYNALVIKNVVDGKSPNGAMDHMRFFRTNLRVAGRSLDLRSIEQDILVKFGDPRVHFALVKADMSSPKLRSEAYDADELDRQLDDAGREFVNDKRRNRFSAALQAARLSRMFELHHDEFGKTDQELLQYLARYIDDEATVKVLERGGYSIKYMDYDASLNGNSMATD